MEMCGQNSYFTEHQNPKLISLFQTEKDAIIFLDLMAYAYKNYDAPVNDGSITHTKGLNIFAAITDNVDGEIIGIGQNSIHSQTTRCHMPSS